MSVRSVEFRALAGALLALTWAASASSDGPPQPMIGAAAPAFDLETVAGGRLALGDLRGRLVVLHFGASW